MKLALTALIQSTSPQPVLSILSGKRNQFIDDDNLSKLSSLTHLLERNDNDDIEETPILKHSPFYSGNQFIDMIAGDTG